MGSSFSYVVIWVDGFEVYVTERGFWVRDIRCCKCFKFWRVVFGRVVFVYVFVSSVWEFLRGRLIKIVSGIF